MRQVLSINTAGKDYANPNEIISHSAFGAEFLGWEPFSNFSSRHDNVDFGHIRWPGGIPVEEGINVDESPDGSREHVFDFKHDNLVEWARNDGSAREGIREMFEYTNESGASFAMVAPTARYVEQMIKEGEDVGLASARSEARYFAEKLVQGEYGQVPDNFTIEVGSEYYATGVWKEETADESGKPYQNDPGELPLQFGKVFASIVDEIHGVVSDPDVNQTGVEVKLAVQLARHHSDPSQNAGSYTDNLDFIEAFIDEGAIDKVDTLLYHRYVPTFENIERGIETDSDGYRLEDAFELWKEASGDQEFEFLGGYLSPSAGAEDRLEYGAPGLTNLLQINASFLAEGMDVGTVYALGHSNGGSLGWREEVLIGGKLYDLMSESIPGKYLFNGFQNNHSNTINQGEAYSQSENVNSYVYGNDQEVVVFLAASDFAGDQLDYTISFDETFVSAKVTRLWDTGEKLYHPGDGDLIGSHGVIANETVELSNTDAGSNLDITFSHDYEVVRISLNKQPRDENSEPGDSNPPGDWIEGEEGDDTLAGYDHQDKINGREGNDLIHGNGGNDTVKGGWGDDTVHGGEGDDKVTGDWGDNLLFGGDGNDSLFGGAGNDTLFGGAGDDRLTTGGQKDWVNGGSGNDTIVANADETIIHFDSVSITQEAREAEVDVVHNFVVGRDFIEIEGVNFGDVEDGMSREEFIQKHGAIRGNDLEIDLGEGHSVILKNVATGLFDDPTIEDFYQVLALDNVPTENEPQAPMDQPNIWVEGEEGDDSLAGQEHQDKINGSEGNDLIHGNGGDDTVKGGWGDDTVHGDEGDDKVTGDWGDDLLFGGDGNDRLFGGPGNDTLFGGAGDDRLTTGGQKDWANGGLGNDTIVANADETIIHFDAASIAQEAREAEVDVVHNFVVGRDFIEIEGVNFGDVEDGISREEFIQKHGALRGNDLEIDLGDGHSVILKNVATGLFEDPTIEDFYQVLAMDSSIEQQAWQDESNAAYIETEEFENPDNFLEDYQFSRDRIEQEYEAATKQEELEDDSSYHFSSTSLSLPF